MSEPYWVPLSGVPAVGPVPACSVYRSAGAGAFNCPNVVATPITFDAERFDTDTMHDVATNSDRITIRTAGKYLLNGWGYWTAGGAGQRRLTLYSSVLAAPVAGHSTIGGASIDPYENVSAIVDCAVGDYFQLYVYQDSGSALGFNSPEFRAIRIDTLFGALAPAGGSSAPLVTSLPASPVDGQECILCDSLSAPTYQWRLKYVAAKASNKWVYIGGAAKLVTVAADETSASGTYGDLTTVGPSIALPVAGDYIVGIGFSATGAQSAVVSHQMSYAIGATGAVDADRVTAATTANSPFLTTGSRFALKAGLAAVTLTAKYAVAGASGHFVNRWMSVEPVALGG